MSVALRALQTAHLVSLDVFFIALAWSCLVHRDIGSAGFSLWAPLTISLSVWATYTIDRLRDGEAIDLARPHWSRHHFHYRNRKALLAFLVMVIGSLTVIVPLRFDRSQVATGICLLALVIVYCWVFGGEGRKSTNQWKGIAVGCLFSLGVCLTELTGPSVSSRMYWILVCLGTLFSLNSVSVAWFESQFDQFQVLQPRRDQRLSVFSVLTIVMVLHFGFAVLLISYLDLPDSFRIAFFSSSILLLINTYLVGGDDTFCRSNHWRLGSARDPTAVPVLIRSEHIGSCLAEAALWFPPAVALIWYS